MISSFRNLTRRELTIRLANALERSAACEADVLALLAEVDARKIYAQAGYSSMFEYCTRALHMSESMAYARIGVARAAQALPILLKRIERGDIHLAGLRQLVPHLTPENHLGLLERAKHKTRDEIVRMLADRHPKPDAPASIRRLPTRAALPEPPAVDPPKTAPMTLPKPKPEPLGRDRFKVQFTADAELHEKLREAQALLRHEIPNGDPAKIIDKALTLLLAERKKRKFGQSPRKRAPKQNQPEAPSRHVPAEIKRHVLARDGARCTYVSPEGRKCGSRDFLEFDHQKPWARFHRHDSDEMRLLCRTHNQYTAELEYGRGHVNRCRTRGQLDSDPVLGPREIVSPSCEDREK